MPLLYSMQGELGLKLLPVKLFMVHFVRFAVDQVGHTFIEIEEYGLING